MIKRIVFCGMAVMAFAALGLFTGCQEKEEPGKTGEPSVSITPASLEFAQGGDTKTITVVASRDWNVKESTVPEGVTVSPMSGGASEQGTEVTVTAGPNTAFDREAKIKFVAETAEALLTFSQKGATENAGSIDDVFTTEAQAVSVKGKVVAVSKVSFVINDGGDRNLLVNDDFSVSVGDVVEVKGKVTRRPSDGAVETKMVQISGDESYELTVKKINETINAAEQEAEVLEGAAIDAYQKEHAAKISIVAHVEVSGQDKFLVFDGASVRGVPVASDFDNMLVTGKSFEITGYFAGIGKNRELYIIPVTVEESIMPFFELTPNVLTFEADADGEAFVQTFSVKSNTDYTTWTIVSSNPDELRVEQNATQIKVIPTKNVTSAERTYKVTVSCDGVSASVDVIQAAPASDEDLEIVLDVTKGNIHDEFPSGAASAGTEEKSYELRNHSEKDDGMYEWTFVPVNGGKFTYIPNYKSVYIGKTDSYLLLPAVEGKKLTQIVLTVPRNNKCKKVAIYTTDGSAAVAGGEETTNLSSAENQVWELVGTQDNTSYQLRVREAQYLYVQKLTLIYK